MLKKIKIGEIEFSFVCEYKNKRSGFKHVCDLYKGTYLLQSSVCNYVNRTWECYPYQSVMKQTVSCVITEIKWQLVDDYKKDNNVKRVKTETKELIYSQSNELKMYNELYNTL